MSDASDFARTYLAYNAAESGADEVIRQLLAEIERLRSCLYAQESVPALYAEIKQLRAALQEILDFPYVGTQASQRIWQIAKAALAGKEGRPSPEEEADMIDGLGSLIHGKP